MKIKKLILVGIVAATAISFSFVGLAPITVTSIRETIVSGIFTDYRDEAADTTITLPSKDYEGNPTTLFPASLCGWDVGAFSGSFSYALDTGYQGYEGSVLTRFKALFGADLIKSKLKLAAKDYEGNAIQIYQYSPLGVQAAFNKLYQKPTSTYKGIGLQKLYNVSAKQYVRDATDMIIAITAKKPIWDAQVKKYVQLATTDEEFYMGSFADETYTKIFGEQEAKECAPYANKMIGSMLRRSGDGTLPVLLVCLKTMLKDYDLEYYNKVALKF
jgi:hypothetical protein